jgi:hypothetical protein
VRVAGPVSELEGIAREIVELKCAAAVADEDPAPGPHTLVGGRPAGRSRSSTSARPASSRLRASARSETGAENPGGLIAIVRTLTMIFGSFWVGLIVELIWLCRWDRRG